MKCVVEGRPILSSEFAADGGEEEEKEDSEEEEEEMRERLVYRVGPKGRFKLISGVDEVCVLKVFLHCGDCWDVHSM